MDINIVRNILLKIEKLKVGETVLIDELNKEFSNISLDDLLMIICRLASRRYIRIDGKYSHECYYLEKYNKVSGLDMDGLEAIGYVKNDKIWNKVLNILNDNDYNFNFFVAVDFAKKIVNKELDDLLNK